LHPREKRHNDLAEIWLKRIPIGIKDVPLSLSPQLPNARNMACSQGNVEHDTLQKFKAPTIVYFARHKPLLYDSQDRNMLARTYHCRSIARKECAQ
jgi:hypothetical protein